MKIRRMVRKFVLKVTHLYVYRALPRGIDLARDIATYLPTYRVDVIFDVGANVGQSAQIYLEDFPQSQIYCFEPVRNTFDQLQRNLACDPRVACYRMALGSAKTTGQIAHQGSSDMFYLLDYAKNSAASHDIKTEDVDIMTIDDFCDGMEIEHINFLKIDTEGSDLEVLKGAVNMLSASKIDLVQVEAGMNPLNRRHVPFESLKAFMEIHKYYLFGIYEQINEWPTREPQLRRVNPVFISRHMIEMYTRA